ncbi:HD domain-containing protein [Rhizobium laguerreae]|uniref:HD domain-containing protein n=1 Tax=Rhizobium laguerreae TaxID=1076926 RepID=UPI001C916D61|nr:ATP-binding protein [Rhizobium laguerreae]MBY3377461.1 hypothetical protein [Rhizobium laguerreae]
MKLEIGNIEHLFRPELFNKVKSSSSFRKSITTCAKFAEWFENSGIPFFKSYTDHSEIHALDVFATAISFMSEAAFDIVTEDDLSILLAASFCHDCGMHLTERQFLALVDSRHLVLYTSIDSKTWPDEWAEFLQDARRMNQDRLIDIFGEVRNVPSIPDDPSDFTDVHRLLIGEFLRRKHPRLAHDIAMGLGEALGFDKLMGEFNNRERDIIGFISRSHGADLRSTFGYLENKYHIREFDNIHIVYLMGLLRLADYAQIQAARAPIARLQLRNVKSPLSSREWRVHQSIVNITRADSDPEAVFIDSRPERVEDFIRVREWLIDLQLEFDRTWAVLGEVYGRQNISGLDRLTLTIRRVRSNIIDGFKTDKFVPDAISFKVAETEMLSLLLAPLYGDNPAYGFRELIQNARDAVLEAQAASASHLGESGGSVEINLTLDDNSALFRIKDNGVGMSVETVKNYFLNAGASYRYSKNWQIDFTDEAGRSRVARSGRFGVGALAAFLIGPKITVRSRHYHEALGRGIEFTTALHDKLISVRYCDCDYGTEIEIPMDIHRAEIAIKHFHEIENFYKFDKLVSVRFEVEAKGSKQIKNLCDDESFLLCGAFPTKKYQNVSWGITTANKRNGTYINGIAIRTLDGRHAEKRHIYDARRFFTPLAYSYYPQSVQDSVDIARKGKLFFEIEDRDALVPLNLARTEIFETDETINNNVDDSYFKEIIDFIGKNKEDISNIIPLSDGQNQQKIAMRRGSLIFKNDIFFPFDAHVIEKYKVDTVFDLGRSYKNSELLNKEFPDTFFSVRNPDTTSRTALATELRHKLDLIEHGKYVYAAFVVHIDLVKNFSEISISTKWMEKAIRDAQKIDESRLLIELGTRVPEIHEKMLFIAKRSTSRSMGAYHSPSYDFFVYSHSWDRPLQTPMSKRWLERFKTLKALDRLRG